MAGRGSIEPSTFWPTPLGGSDTGAGRGRVQSWELGLAFSSCLALSTCHAKTIYLFPQRKMCGQTKKPNHLWKSGEGHCLPLTQPLCIPLPLSPIASPSSPCLWMAARILSRLEGVGKEERTPELTCFVTSDKLSALSGLPFNMRGHIAFRRPEGQSSWLFRSCEPGSPGILGAKREWVFSSPTLS